MAGRRGFKTDESKIEFIIDFLDTKIKELQPDFRNKLFQIAICNLDKSRNEIKTIIKNEFPKITAIGKNFWIYRGWSNEVAEINFALKKHTLSRNKKLSPFSREFWLDKINDATSEKYTEEEAEYKRNSIRPIRKEYWLEKGFSEEDAIRHAIGAKRNNNIKGAQNNYKRASYRINLSNCKEYWMNLGFSEEDAIGKVKQRQTTFSLETCIEKYGEIEGQTKWQERQNKWQNTLLSKSQEEIERINNSKMWKSGMVSKISQELFNALAIPNARYGQNTDGEKLIKLSSGKNVMVDYFYNGKIIEFFGDYWHANPIKYSKRQKLKRVSNRMITDVEEIWKKDKERISQLEELGYEVLVIWENDYRKNKHEIINKCRDFINETT